MLLVMHTSPAIATDEQMQRYEFLQIRMGIPVNIVLYAPSEATANQAAEAAYSRIREIDRCMSDYDPDSELMQLCYHYDPTEKTKVSSDLFHVLAAAQKLSERTDGAFDVTVGPVVKLWRIARRRKQMPDHNHLATAMKAVGSEFIRLDHCSQTVQLLKPDMRIDLGGIAKGYAADEALAAIKQNGLTCAMIDAGGDIVAGDSPPGRDYWRIEVEKLKGSRGDTSGGTMVALRNRAVATSGDAYQFLELDGVRYSHIVDPKTGLGLTTPSTVTVIAPTGMQADSLASAISVLGPIEGLKLVHATPNVEAMLVINESPGQIREVASAGFSKFVVKNSGEVESSDHQ